MWKREAEEEVRMMQNLTSVAGFKDGGRNVDGHSKPEEARKEVLP